MKTFYIITYGQDAWRTKEYGDIFYCGGVIVVTRKMKELLKEDGVSNKKIINIVSTIRFKEVSNLVSWYWQGEVEVKNKETIYFTIEKDNLL